MKLYKEYPKPDPQKIHESLKKATGSKHPENIHGYQMFFTGGFDIWISDNIANRLGAKEFKNFIDECIKQWRGLHCGEVTRDTADINLECIGLGNGKPRYACYTFRPGERCECRIKFRNNKYYDYIAYEWEYDAPWGEPPKETA